MNRYELSTLLKSQPTTRDRIGEPHAFRNEKRREITSEWEVCPGESDTGDEGTIVLSMTSYHHGNRKAYGTTLRVEFVGENFRQTTIAFGTKGESVNVHSSPCARFSAKTMREHHAHCLYLVQECSADHCGMTLEEGIKQYLPKVVT